MTDPRFGEGLLRAVQKLPAGSGVVFRHYALDASARAALFAKVRRICARRGHILLCAGDAQNRPVDGMHGEVTRQGLVTSGIRSVPVHNVQEIKAAVRAGADMLFLSPLHATRSHPDARPLGPYTFRRLAELAYPTPVIALGGMSRARAAMIPQHIAYGWAAIDAFMLA